MMATPSSSSVESLRATVNEVLVQAGKALRAAQRNGNDSLDDLAKALKSRLPPSLTAFHEALDEIEIEITRAKAVLRRDLSELRPEMASPILVPVSPAPPQDPASADAAADEEEEDVVMQEEPPPEAPTPAILSDISSQVNGQTPANDSASPETIPSVAGPSRADSTATTSSAAESDAAQQQGAVEPELAEPSPAPQQQQQQQPDISVVSLDATAAATLEQPAAQAQATPDLSKNATTSSSPDEVHVLGADPGTDKLSGDDVDDHHGEAMSSHGGRSIEVDGPVAETSGALSAPLILDSSAAPSGASIDKAETHPEHAAAGSISQIIIDDDDAADDPFDLSDIFEDNGFDEIAAAAAHDTGDGHDPVTAVTTDGRDTTEVAAEVLMSPASAAAESVHTPTS